MGILCCNYGRRSTYETDDEYDERRRSHCIVFFTQFNVVITYSAMLIGIWPYLQKIDPLASKSFLGYLIAASALGQVVFAPVVGWWSNRLNSSRIPFIVTLVVLMASHVIYATLELFSHQKYWMLASRLLAGIGSSNFALCRSHVGATTLIRERRKVVTILSSCATVSFALGPAVQALAALLDETGIVLVPEKLTLDMYTAVGWIGVLLTSINIALFVPHAFVEHPIAQKEASDSNERPPYLSTNYKRLAMLFILLNFALTFNVMFLKVLGTPLAMDEYAITRTKAITLNFYVVTVSACISFVSIVLINPICKFMSEMTLLTVSLVLMVLGRFCLYPFTAEKVQILNDVNLNATVLAAKEHVGCRVSQQEWCRSEGKIFFFQFILGSAIESIAYAIAITLTMTVFSQVLGARKQGTWMGFLTAFGGIARITAPVFSTTIYDFYGPSVASVVTNILFAGVSIFVMKYADTLLLGDNEEDGNEGKVEAEGAAEDLLDKPSSSTAASAIEVIRH